MCEASTKAGKTVGVLAWLIEGAVKYPGQRSKWISPIFPQAEEQGYQRMERLLADVPGIKTNASKLIITWPNGHRHFFKGADRTDSLYGPDDVRVVVDEASRCKEGWLQAAISTTTATDGQIRVCGNVRGRTNSMFKLARLGEQGADFDGERVEYHKITAQDAIDAGVLKPSTIEFARATLPHAIFRELYFCEPTDDGGNPFGFQHIERNVRPISDRPAAVYGVDVAKSKDWTVVFGVDDRGDCCLFERWQHTPWPETIRRIGSIVGETPTLMDKTGVGSSPLDHLQETHANVEGFLFTNSSKQSLMSNLAIELQAGRAGVPDNETKAELESFEYAVTGHGSVSYSAPAGLHDDCVCAMALAHEMKRRYVPIQVIGAPEATDEYAGLSFSERRSRDVNFGFDN